MSPSETPPVDDPPEDQWIERFIAELRRLSPRLGAQEATDESWDAWRDYRGVFSPEESAARTIESWNDFGMIHEP